MDEKAKKDIIAIYMESPIYLTISLRKRLELVNRQFSCDNSREAFLYWVKTGIFNLSFTIEHQVG